jgi:hypothetical protein
LLTRFVAEPIRFNLWPIGCFMKNTALYAKTRRKKKRAPRDRRWTLAAYKRALERKLYGSLGPASACRKIDPATGEVVATIPARTPEA